MGGNSVFYLCLPPQMLFDMVQRVFTQPEAAQQKHDVSHAAKILQVWVLGTRTRRGGTVVPKWTTLATTMALDMFQRAMVRPTPVPTDWSPPPPWMGVRLVVVIAASMLVDPVGTLQRMAAQGPTVLQQIFRWWMELLPHHRSYSDRRIAIIGLRWFFFFFCSVGIFFPT